MCLPEPGRLAPGTMVGRFRVEEPLGTGGMGEVYRAWDPTLERSVALKALRPVEAREPGALERFRREALALAQLNHPHVCQVHDWVEGASGTYIAMELVPGRTLDKAAPDLRERDRLGVVRAIAQALEAAHAKGLVHRDLKPANIMVAHREGKDPLVKVLDFGLARLLDPTAPAEAMPTPSAVPNLALLEALGSSSPAQDVDDAATSRHPSHRSRPAQATQGLSGSPSWERLTQAGTFMGSPAYASPEQIQGQAAGPASDVFSLGIVAWELFTGDHPFPGEGRARMQAIVQGDRRTLARRHLPSETRDLLMAMLDPHPFKRPTAAKVAEALDRILKPKRALRWVLATTVTALVLALGINGFLTRGVIADLTRKRPARLVVLPFLNGTGEGRYNGLVHRAFPEDIGAQLAELPQLQVVDQETLARAARTLGLNLALPLDPAARARLAGYLGAALVLRGDVQQRPELGMNYVLEDAAGHVRSQGAVHATGAPMVALQALPTALVAQVRRAVDPLNRARPSSAEGISGNALLAYGQALDLMSKGAYKEALPLMRTAAFQSPFASGPVVGYATCLYRTGDPATDAALRWALNAARLSKDSYREVVTLKALGLREREQGHLEAAATACREGVALAEKGGFGAQRASILSNLGLVLQDQGHLDDAKTCFTQAAEVQRRLPDPQGLANAINNLAVLARKRGAFAEAEANYQESLTLQRAQGNRYGEALALTNLGDLALSQRRFNEARAFLVRADGLYQETGNRTERAVCQLNLGVLDQCLLDFSSAEAAFQTAGHLAEEAQAPPTAALAWFYLANLSRQRGRLDEATGRYTLALRRFQSLGADSEWGECLAGLAECALLRPSPNLKEADRLLKDAALKAKATDPFLLRALWRQARAMGQKDLAGRLLDQARAAAGKDEPEVAQELEALKPSPAR